MASTWFICPYDVIDAGGGPLRFRRELAIKRYVPVSPSPEGVSWDEAESLGNHAAVKVVWPALPEAEAKLAAIRADADFTEFDPLSEIPSNRRNFVRNKLENLGFTQAEIDNTGFVVTAILALLTTAMGIVGRNAGNTGLEVKPGRRVAAKTAAQVEARLPG